MLQSLPILKKQNWLELPKGAWIIFRASPAIALLVIVSFSTITSPAQDEPFDPNAAPPPIKRMSKDEQKRLQAADGPKDRVSAAIDLMESRLRSAEADANAAQYGEMYEQLGAFQAIMDDTIDFLYESLNRRQKVFDSFKRFEIKLRGFAPRLALIRRDVPPAYEPYLRNLLKYLRDARSKAVEPLFAQPTTPRNQPSI